MKKLLLGLGTTSLAILPIVGMVSCSTTEKTHELDITLVSDWTTVTEETINNAIIQIKAATNNGGGSQSDNEALIKALNLIFKGVDSSNVDMFQIEYSETTPSVTLKGKLDDGIQNTFKGSKLEDKKEITTIISDNPTKTIPISLKDTITQNTIDDTIIAYTASLEDINGLPEILNKVFVGFTIDILKVDPAKPQLYIQIIAEVGMPKKIAILAGVDYKFTDDSTLLIATPRP
ncbi:MAG: hypothetical protein ACRCWU_02320 [Metamycoplasmataceae bacterium]